MSSELRTQLNNIVEEKNTKIIPENIKLGIQIFDVIGTYDGEAPAITQEEYDAVIAERDALSVQIQELQIELYALQTSTNNLQTAVDENEELINQILGEEEEINE